jgi:hypothetical protein
VDDLPESFFPAYTLGEELDDAEIPEGTVVKDAEGNFYRFESNGTATEIDAALRLGVGRVLEKFFLSLEDVEDRLGLSIARMRVADTPASDVLDGLMEKFKTVDTSLGSVSVGREYLLAFHACNESEEDCFDPSTHKVYLAESDNGTDWSLVPGWEPFSGSVPDVIRREDTLYIYTANNELVRVDLNTGEEGAQTDVWVEGLDEGFVDPSLILDEDGRLVLFFLYGMTGGDPAHCGSGETSCRKVFGSATEVEGSDGEEFILDDGDRAVVTINSDEGPVYTASDPDIFFDGEQYVMYITYGPEVSVWTSSDLRGEYTEIFDELSGGAAGIPSGFFDSGSEKYWTYGHGRPSGDIDEPNVILRAVHTTLDETVPADEWETVLSGESIGLGEDVMVESPGFAVNE